MTYVVTPSCVQCKSTDCVEVCPVDCFYDGGSMLYIHPDECIDCGVCEPECPAGAIKSDTEHSDYPKIDLWVILASDYAEKSPNIDIANDPRGENNCNAITASPALDDEMFQKVWSPPS